MEVFGKFLLKFTKLVKVFYVFSKEKRKKTMLIWRKWKSGEDGDCYGFEKKKKN